MTGLALVDSVFNIVRVVVEQTVLIDDTVDTFVDVADTTKVLVVRAVFRTLA